MRVNVRDVCELLGGYKNKKGGGILVGVAI